MGFQFSKKEKSPAFFGKRLFINNKLLYVAGFIFCTLRNR